MSDALVSRALSLALDQEKRVLPARQVTWIGRERESNGMSELSKRVTGGSDGNSISSILTLSLAEVEPD